MVGRLILVGRLVGWLVDWSIDFGWLVGWREGGPPHVSGLLGRGAAWLGRRVFLARARRAVAVTCGAAALRCRSFFAPLHLLAVPLFHPPLTQHTHTHTHTHIHTHTHTHTRILIQQQHAGAAAAGLGAFPVAVPPLLRPLLGPPAGLRTGRLQDGSLQRPPGRAHRRPHPPVRVCVCVCHVCLVGYVGVGGRRHVCAHVSTRAHVHGPLRAPLWPSPRPPY